MGRIDRFDVGCAGCDEEPSADGKWVRWDDHAAVIADKDAEIERLKIAVSNAIWRSVLAANKVSDLDDTTRRLALAVAEVKAWRQADLRHDWIRDNTAGGVAATREVDNLICDMNATDADPVLAKMIGGGE